MHKREKSLPAVVTRGDRQDPRQRTYMQGKSKSFGVSGGYVDLSTIPECERPKSLRQTERAMELARDEQRRIAKRARRARARAKTTA